MRQPPFPSIHTVANARAEALDSEAATLRAEADALLSLIDELCDDADHSNNGRHPHHPTPHAA